MIEAIFDSRRPGWWSNFYADCLFVYYIVMCQNRKVRAVNSHESLLSACKVFSFIVSDDLPDDDVIGRIRTVPVHVGDMRRLNAAIALAEQTD